MKNLNPSHDIWIVFGTRPEYIKLAPLIRWLRTHTAFTVRVIQTGQHETLGMDTGLFFGIKPDDVLPLQPRDRTRLSSLYSSIQKALEDQLTAHGFPSCMIVQGDTLSAFTAAETAYRHHIKVLHVEAGLRTRNIKEPWPEELFRVMISRFASWHFVPTEAAKYHLLSEGISSDRVIVTGNTVVDAFNEIRNSHSELFIPGSKIYSQSVDSISHDSEKSRRDTINKKQILLTLHRRENQKSEQAQIATCLKSYISEHPDIYLTIIKHPNPSSHYLPNLLQDHPSVQILKAMNYPEFLTLMSQMDIIITDSGGLQEEAPLLGIPVIVLRNVTERPEILSSGYGSLTGSNPQLIHEALDSCLSRLKLPPIQLFGDGRASERIGSFLMSLVWQGTDRIHKNLS